MWIHPRNRLGRLDGVGRGASKTGFIKSRWSSTLHQYVLCRGNCTRSRLFVSVENPNRCGGNNYTFVDPNPWLPNLRSWLGGTCISASGTRGGHEARSATFGTLYDSDIEQIENEFDSLEYEEEVLSDDDFDDFNE